MFLLIGLIAGLVFGLASAFANRFWGTVLACLPIAGWFVLFAFAQQGGYTGREATNYALALFGVLIGMFMGQIFDRQRRKIRTPRRR